MTLAHRYDGIPPTIFSRMSALAVRHQAVNLGQGFPDADGPGAMLDAAADAIHAHANQYAPGPGIPVLRQAISAHQQRHYGLTPDPDNEVVVTTGATEGIAAAILGLVNPGDEVVVLEPYYDSYVAMLQVAGAVRRPVRLTPPDYRVPLEELRAAITPRTRFMLLNSPHNPTGMVLNDEERRTIAALAVKHDLIVITDEVYEHLTFDAEHVPLATLPGMWERTLTLSSAGKSYSVTGWKVGWATGPLAPAVLAAKQWLTFTSGSAFQPSVAHALTELPDWPRELAKDLQHRRDLLCDGLTGLGLETNRPEGTYFALTDVSSLGWDSGLDFCLALPERAGVVAIPCQVFHEPGGGQQLVRWAFCKEAATIELGLEKLARTSLSA